jgi:serine/threonine-protein kinase
MGTAQYLSPEQAQGHAVSQQSDLYSIGVVLYEMLAGRVPFEGESAVTIALKQVGEAPVPPSAYNGAVTPALEQVVLRALEKDPAARFPDADAFIDALEAARYGVEDPAQSTMLVPAAAPPVLPAGSPPSFGHAAPRPHPEDEGPGRRWWLFAIAALLAVGILLALLLLLRGDEVTVPNVVGSDLATAQSRLQSEGFSVDTVARTSDRPQREVLGQDPEPGARADEGSVVTLTVSDGPGRATVPDVEGQGEREAKRRLEDAGFEVRSRERTSDSVPRGDVIGTQPGAGSQVERGSTLVLLVSSGPQRAAVPNVVGQTQESASSALTAAGFEVTVEQREDEDARPGTVLSQSPAAGEQADRGAAVTIVVAQEPEQVSVPSVVGEDQATAIERLTEAGLRVREQSVTVDDEAQEGTVVQQDPSGGRARRGSTVTIGVGSFTPPPEPTTPTTTPGGAVPGDGG